MYILKKVNKRGKNCSSNIMVIGETGVGKSTWIHGFINYMQGIQIEEKIDIIFLMKKRFN